MDGFKLQTSESPIDDFTQDSNDMYTPDFKDGEVENTQAYSAEDYFRTDSGGQNGFDQIEEIGTTEEILGTEFISEPIPSTSTSVVLETDDTCRTPRGVNAQVTRKKISDKLEGDRLRKQSLGNTLESNIPLEPSVKRSKKGKLVVVNFYQKYFVIFRADSI